MSAAGFWDAQAATFDTEADHGLGSPAVREAWRDLLLAHLPATPASVADLGCGTGSLACLLAAEGFAVTGVDFAPRMIAAARAKAGRLPVTFLLGDAAAPPLADRSFDVVLARHVLWALPDPGAALARWSALLRPGGRFVLVEGRWHTGAGLGPSPAEALVRRHHDHVRVEPLPDPALWGGPITDERYLVLSTA